MQFFTLGRTRLVEFIDNCAVATVQGQGSSLTRLSCPEDRFIGPMEKKFDWPREGINGVHHVCLADGVHQFELRGGPRAGLFWKNQPNRNFQFDGQVLFPYSEPDNPSLVHQAQDTIAQVVHLMGQKPKEELISNIDGRDEEMMVSVGEAQVSVKVFSNGEVEIGGCHLSLDQLIDMTEIISWTSTSRLCFIDQVPGLAIEHDRARRMTTIYFVTFPSNT